MQADESLVAHITSTYYNISPVLGSIKQLHGYYDLNFLLTDSSSNKTYILKIVNQHDSSRELTDIVDTVLDNAHEYCQAKRTSVSGQHFLVPRLIRTIDGKLSTFTHMKYRDVSSSTSTDDTTSDASEEEVECNIKLSEFFAGQSMFDYMNECKKSMKLEPAQYNRLYFNLGRVCNQLFVFLQTQQRSLVDKLEEIRSRSYSTNSWLLKADEQFIRKHLDHIYPNDDDDDNNSRRQLVDNVLKEYATITRPKLAQLDEYIVHSDLNLTNMLAPPYDCNKSIHDPDNLEICLIDFQDIQTGYQMTDFATLILYSVLGHAFGDLTESLVKIPRYIYTGYHSDGTEFPMDVSQLKLVPSLIKYQLCKTLLNLEMADSHEEEYSYATHVIRQGWPLLEIMCSHSEYSNSDQLVSLWTRASE